MQEQREEERYRYNKYGYMTAAGYIDLVRDFVKAHVNVQIHIKLSR